jgi:hypothetical protein
MQDKYQEAAHPDRVLQLFLFVRLPRRRFLFAAMNFLFPKGLGKCRDTGYGTRSEQRRQGATTSALAADTVGA